MTARGVARAHAWRPHALNREREAPYVARVSSERRMTLRPADEVRRLWPVKLGNPARPPLESLTFFREQNDVLEDIPKAAVMRVRIALAFVPNDGFLKRPADTDRAFQEKPRNGA